MRMPLRKNGMKFRAYQSSYRLILSVSFLLAMLDPSMAQTRPPDETISRTRAAQTFPMARMLSEISARNIEQSIRKLVSFGTRNTLSAQDNPNRGIGAAANWLLESL